MEGSPGTKPQLLGLDQTPADREVHQARCFVDAEFSHQPCTVKLGGLHADGQLRGDLFGRFSLTH